MVAFRETVTVDAAVAEVAQVLQAVERWPSWTASVVEGQPARFGTISGG
jgi:hypothetical protein